MHEDQNLSRFLQSFRALVFDYGRGIGELWLRDGRVAEFPLEIPSDHGLCIMRSVYDLDENLLVMLLPNGEQVSAEVHFTDEIVALRGRPVVYLDQGHWSTLARVKYDEGGVRPDDVEPARKILTLARENKIVLPISSAHMIETTVLYGEKRQNIATVMLEASHGWIMRDPLDVRQEELISTLLKRYRSIEKPLRSAFTSDHSRLYPRQFKNWRTFLASDDLPQFMNQISDRLTQIASTYDTLMDSEGLLKEDHLSAWARHHRQLAEEVAQRGESSGKRRSLGLLANIVDINREVALAATAAGLSLDQLEEWFTKHRDIDVAAMPFFGLYADSIAIRLSDSQRKWTGNDLIDGLYLSCAAAYADAVGGERSATNYIRSSWRDRPGKAPIFATLAELFAYIDGSLLPDASKRESV